MVHCNLHDVCRARHSSCCKDHVQVRVMPNCWYLLVRFFLRVDRMFVRLREARLFCDLRQVQRRWHNHFIRAA